MGYFDIGEKICALIINLNQIINNKHHHYFLYILIIKLQKKKKTCMSYKEKNIINRVNSPIMGHLRAFI